MPSSILSRLPEEDRSAVASTAQSAANIGGGLINTAIKAAQAAQSMGSPSVTGSGGGGSTGGGGHVAPAPVATGTTAVGGGGGSTDLVSQPNTSVGGATTGSTAVEDYTEDQIAAAMAALEAQFSMTREELLADKSYAGLAYKRLIGELRRVRETAAEATQQDALRRGLFRSGIHAEQQAEVQRDFAEQQSAAAAERNNRVQAINQMLAELQAQEEAAKAEREAQIRTEALVSGAGQTSGGSGSSGVTANTNDNQADLISTGRPARR